MKKTTIILTILGIGIFGLFYLNKNFLNIWNANQVMVSVDSGLSEDKVKIEHGISVNTISRVNDLDLFNDRGKYAIVFDGKPRTKIENEYGENDFLLTYEDEYYLSFRQFKFNRKHQHNYKFKFIKSEDNPIVEADIDGKDGMNFRRKMIKIKDAEKYVCNTPLDSAGTIYNMVELKKE
ncbi:MAG: hypothetical protein GC192_09025 [Bacteroidetes bacterium]|nr:hypothetical protein [Bacteroidota bacterium]